MRKVPWVALTAAMLLVVTMDTASAQAYTADKIVIKCDPKTSDGIAVRFGLRQRMDRSRHRWSSRRPLTSSHDEYAPGAPS